MLSEVQVTTARLLASGRSARSVGRMLHVGRDTIRKWQRDPEFVDEYERALARGGAPDPRATLLDALSARRDDGVDWPSRLRAALALLEQDASEDDDRTLTASERW